MFYILFFTVHMILCQVWTWGKGEYYRLGLGRGEHVRRPTLVDQLKLVTIEQIAVGTLHCIAVSTQGDVSCDTRVLLLTTVTIRSVQTGLSVFSAFLPLFPDKLQI